MKLGLTLAALMLLVAPARAQEKTTQEKLDELAQEVEKLKKRVTELEGERDRIASENARLKGDLESYQKQCLETAQELIRLRQLLKNGGGRTESSSGTKTTDAKPAKTDEKPDFNEIEDGPETPIRGRVQVIDKTQGFVLLDVGSADGVKVGYLFEIIREFKNDKGETQFHRIAVGKVDKILGSQNNHTKLKIVEGKVGDVNVDDPAIAMRKTKKAGGGGTGDPKKETPATRTFKITGTTNDVYLLNYGARDGAKQSDIVFVYRDSKLRAKLRLDTVDKEYSIGKIVEGSSTAAINDGDEISLQELKQVLCCRIKKIDARTGIWLDIGSDNGVKVGMVFKVQRLGKDIGQLTITKVDKFWAIAAVSGETKLEDLQEKDYAEEKK